MKVWLIVVAVVVVALVIALAVDWKNLSAYKTEVTDKFTQMVTDVDEKLTALKAELTEKIDTFATAVEERFTKDESTTASLTTRVKTLESARVTQRSLNSDYKKRIVALEAEIAVLKAVVTPVE